MEGETVLERFQRAFPVTYAQLYANVELFCESHGSAINVAHVFAVIAALIFSTLAHF